MRYIVKHKNNKTILTDLKHHLQLLFIKFNKNGYRVTGYEFHPALQNHNNKIQRLEGYCKNNYINMLRFKNSDLPQEINVNVANAFIYDIMYFNKTK